MDVAKIKAALPNLNLKLLKPHQLRSLMNRVDKTAFIRGMVAVTGLYLLLFLYIYIQSTATVARIIETIPSETVTLTNVTAFQSEKISKTAHKDIRLPPPDEHAKDIIIDGLYEETPQGLLPVIRESDNLTAFRAYQHPYTWGGVTKKPVISFIVLDFGLSKKLSQDALDTLPPEVSLSLSPYSTLPNEWVKMAQDKGHEIWLNLPIQNSKTSDMGENTIFHHISLPEKISVLHKTLSRAQGYAGLSGFTDDGVLAASEHYIRIMTQIYERGIGFVELNPNAPDLLQTTALTFGAPYMKANINVINMTGEEQSFDALEKAAQKNGHAIAVVPGYTKTIKNLAVWILKVGQTDYNIAPVSAIYDFPFYEHDTEEKH